MIRTGDTLHNPVTGEIIRFVKAAADTGGEYVLIEVVVEPNGAVAAAHVHTYQTETFEILEGELTFRTGKETIVAKAGDTVRVDPGTPHKFWNDGETDARFRTEIRPALQFESLIETMFGLASDGKTNRKGNAEPTSARGDRESALRRRAAPVPARLDAEGRPRDGRTARPAARVPADLRARRAFRGLPRALGQTLTQRHGARR
jgi:quercetin dioxygenase-like cupin family protein